MGLEDIPPLKIMLQGPIIAELPQQTFALLMKRFDIIEAQNKTQLDLQIKHAEDDSKVHKIVERHTTYFKLVGVGIPMLMAYGLSRLGLKL